jgi:hypothetical protein
LPIDLRTATSPNPEIRISCETVTSRPSATALRAARRVFPIDVEIPDDAFGIGQTSLQVTLPQATG